MASTYGAVIKRLRTEKKWSIEELAKQAGVNYQTAWRAEHSMNVGVLLIEQIAVALGVKIGALFGGLPKTPEWRPSFWSRLNDEHRKRLETLAKRYADEDTEASAAGQK